MGTARNPGARSGAGWVAWKQVQVVLSSRRTVTTGAGSREGRGVDVVRVADGKVVAVDALRF